ncbi:PREDICTED: thiosulfate sulfurtransferase/rhodanese-like domain-containing protein 1 [Priapulus caudatus]|uniref:Thiosulfate sulfurtransferase/rhodanese-like domain-containing protein 1 n=1 Tax=Priapulus caudatus TaxID=37621 RepID=A0ABM1EYC5_PRICU|nr:PREDICTED: thiosulfate sulfurtransferase/rhodanese-like domain-containing protein 1 [Priapulus caudatus]
MDVISYDDLIAGIKKKELHLFDVRSPEECAATGTMPTAVNIPLGQLEEALSMTPALFKVTYGVDKPPADSMNVVFSCQAGNRSKGALATAKQRGYSKARHYPGGIREWLVKNNKP